MTTPTPFTPRLELRHVQFLRAGFAALAAVMVTFSEDHSAPLGLSVFSGFAIATALVLFLAAWLTYAPGHRASIVTQAVFTLVAGMVAGVGGLRTEAMLFSVLIAWALITGLTEALSGWRSPRPRSADARDAITIGAVTMLLGLLVLVVAIWFAPQPYTVEGRDFVLTSTIMAVGLFGGYAAIVAVFLAIAGFSPRRAAEPGLTRSDVDLAHEALTDAPTSTPASNASRDNA